MTNITKKTRATTLELQADEKVILEKGCDLTNSPHHLIQARDQGRIILTNKRLIYICTMMLAKGPNTIFQIDINDIVEVGKANVQILMPMGMNIKVKAGSTVLNGEHAEIKTLEKEGIYKFAILGRKEIILQLSNLIN